MVCTALSGITGSTSMSVDWPGMGVTTFRGTVGEESSDDIAITFASEGSVLDVECALDVSLETVGTKSKFKVHKRSLRLQFAFLVATLSTGRLSCLTIAGGDINVRIGCALPLFEFHPAPKRNDLGY